MLKITSDGRKLGLDQRLMNTLLPDDPDSKLNACVGNIPVSYTHLDVYKRQSQSGVSDGAVPEGQPRTGQGNAADGVGAAHEQPESTGGGSRDDGACLLYTSFRAGNI